MFWRSVGKWSLTTRLTIWFTVAFAVAFSTAIAVTHMAILRASDQQLEEELPLVCAVVHERRAEYALLAVKESFVARIVDPAGNVYFERPGAAENLSGLVFPAPGGRAEVSGPGGVRLLLRTFGIDGWTYQVVIDPSDDNKIVAPIYRGIAALVGPIFVVALVVGFLVARAGLRPLRRLKTAVRKIGPDRLDQRLPLTGMPPEIRELATAFNLTIERLSSTFARLEQFAVDVAHEIRTPVHNIRATADLGLTSDGPADDPRARALGDVIEEADRLARLVDRLLILARVSDPRAVVAAEFIDIAAELTSIQSFFAPSAEDAGVSLTTSCSPSLTAHVDRTLFVRAVSNLVSNALAATSFGGRVEIAATSGASGLVIEVLDNGPGIRREVLPMLFERYYRPPGADRGSGLGLGLAIVKRVVELHGGSVGVSSTPGMGSTFQLVFPPWKNPAVSSA
jgi:two-component system heavy metal sensor histidine kinase CusS